MSSSYEYRMNAEDCLRMAHTEQSPLWAMLAHSWRQLAEQVDRMAADTESHEDAREVTEQTAH